MGQGHHTPVAMGLMVMAVVFLMAATVTATDGSDEGIAFVEAVSPHNDNNNNNYEDPATISPREHEIHHAALAVLRAVKGEKKAARAHLLAVKTLERSKEAVDMARAYHKIPLSKAKLAYVAAQKSESTTRKHFADAWKLLTATEKHSSDIVSDAGQPNLVSKAEGALLLVAKRNAAVHKGSILERKLNRRLDDEAFRSEQEDMDVNIESLSAKLTPAQLKRAQAAAAAAMVATRQVRGEHGLPSGQVINGYLTNQFQGQVDRAGHGVGDSVVKAMHKKHNLAALNGVVRASLESEEAVIASKRVREELKELHEAKARAEKILEALKPVLAAVRNTTANLTTVPASTQHAALRGVAAMERAIEDVQAHRALIHSNELDRVRLAKRARTEIERTKSAISAAEKYGSAGADAIKKVQEEAKADEESVVQPAQKTGVAQAKAVAKEAGNLVVHTIAAQKMMAKKMGDSALMPVKPDEATAAAQAATAEGVKAVEKEQPDDPTWDRAVKKRWDAVSSKADDEAKALGARQTGDEKAKVKALGVNGVEEKNTKKVKALAKKKEASPEKPKKATAQAQANSPPSVKEVNAEQKEVKVEKQTKQTIHKADDFLKSLGVKPPKDELLQIDTAWESEDSVEQLVSDAFDTGV